MKFADILRALDLKKLMYLPIGMLLLALLIILANYKAGTIPMSVELKGGTLVTVYGVPQGIELKSALARDLGMEFKVGTVRDLAGDEVGKTLETNVALSNVERDRVKGYLESKGVEGDNITIRSVGPSISARFLREAIKAIVFAFAFMAVVIFIRFRTLVPSFAVVLSAFSDVVTTFAIMILLGIELSPGSIVALLLLIGYSVDTDILLTTRLTARKIGSFEERLLEAMKTGMTMSMTTLAGVVAVLLVTTSAVLREIAAVITIGLLVDIINTWIQNARILQWHLERSRARGGTR